MEVTGLSRFGLEVVNPLPVIDLPVPVAVLYSLGQSLWEVVL